MTTTVVNKRSNGFNRSITALSGRFEPRPGAEWENRQFFGCGEHEGGDCWKLEANGEVFRP
jgi:hypothetical protein